MQRRTKNTSQKKKKKTTYWKPTNPTIQTHEPIIFTVTNHGAFLPFALTKHKALMCWWLGKSNGSTLGKSDGSVASEGRE